MQKSSILELVNLQIFFFPAVKAHEDKAYDSAGHLYSYLYSLSTFFHNQSFFLSAAAVCELVLSCHSVV
jgi:hypothetical protein